MQDVVELLREKSKEYFIHEIKLSLPKDKLELSKENPPIVYGAGIVGRSVCKALAGRLGISVSTVIDNDPSLWGNSIVPTANVISLEEGVKKYLNSSIIVASVIYETEIIASLKMLGFSRVFAMSQLNFLYPKLFDYRDYNSRFEALFKPNARGHISSLYNQLADSESKRILSMILSFRLHHYFGVQMDSIMSANPQYFDPDVIELSSKEVFLDGGAYDGDTLKYIFNNPKYSGWRTYSFEPDPENFIKLSGFVRSRSPDHSVLVNKGLWDKTDEMTFLGLGTPESGISNQDNFSSWSGGNEHQANLEKLSVVSIDQYFAKIDPPTYIKMDIEGAELEALKGSKNIIVRYHPKLAICIYHKPNDLWTIPLYILSLDPTYKIHIRHYSREICETICYAI